MTFVSSEKVDHVPAAGLKEIPKMDSVPSVDRYRCIPCCRIAYSTHGVDFAKSQCSEGPFETRLFRVRALSSRTEMLSQHNFRPKQFVLTYEIRTKDRRLNGDVKGLAHLGKPRIYRRILIEEQKAARQRLRSRRVVFWLGMYSTPNQLNSVSRLFTDTGWTAPNARHGRLQTKRLVA